MPAFWLAVTAVIDADQQRPDERRHFPGQREQSEILRDAVFRRQANQQRARRRLQRTAGATDQASEQQIGALRRAGKQCAARLRRGDLDEQDGILVDQQDGNDRRSAGPACCRRSRASVRACHRACRRATRRRCRRSPAGCRTCRSESCASRTCRRHRCRRTQTATPARRCRSCWRAETPPSTSASAIRRAFASTRPGPRATLRPPGSFAG